MSMATRNLLYAHQTCCGRRVFGGATWLSSLRLSACVKQLMQMIYDESKAMSLNFWQIFKFFQFVFYLAKHVEVRQDSAVFLGTLS